MEAGEEKYTKSANLSLQEPEKISNSNGDDKEYPVLRFFPPVSQQRYARVAELLQGLLLENDKGEDKTILDVGCGDLELHPYLKDLTGIGKLIYLDNNRCTLGSCKTKFIPDAKDYECTRKTKLVAELYEGSITQIDPQVLLAETKIFAVVAIELIEHLEPEVLIGFENSTFGILKPSVVLVTTPNFEFNVFFELANGFRHWDHKYEWTRAEFNCWCEKICEEYPEYSFETEGIGTVDEFVEEFGSVSQLAVFKLRADADSKVSLPKRIPVPVPDCIQEGCYKLITQTTYCASSDEKKILEAFTYFVASRRVFAERELTGRFNPERTELKIPLHFILGIQGMPTHEHDQVILEKITSVLEEAGYEFVANLDDQTGEIEVCLNLALPSPRDIAWLE